MHGVLDSTECELPFLPSRASHCVGKTEHVHRKRNHNGKERCGSHLGCTHHEFSGSWRKGWSGRVEAVQEACESQEGLRLEYKVGAQVRRA